MFSYQNYTQMRWFKPVLKGWGKMLNHLKTKQLNTVKLKTTVAPQKQKYLRM